jgi:hypothetical protein
MTSCARVICVATAVLSGLIGSAVADDLTLTKDCEEGFRRLLHMAQAGQLGDDVRDANISVDGIHVRVELVRPGAANAVVLLTPKRSPRSSAKYFDVARGDNATENDVARVGRALDAVFSADPFQVLGHEGSPAGDRMPSLMQAWSSGSWRGVGRLVERRMMVLASLEYTVGVIVALALGLIASLAVLWGSVPLRDQ